MQATAAASQLAPPPLSAAPSAYDGPLGKLSVLPTELLCHHVLPYAASAPHFYTRFAATCRRGRQAAHEVAVHVVQRYAQDLVRSASSRMPPPEPNAVRFTQVTSADAKRAEQYLRLLSGAVALQRAFRLVEANPAKSLSLFEDVLERWPDTPHVFLGMARAHYRHGRNFTRLRDAATAEHHFRRAHALAPEHPETNLALSMLLYERGDHADAINFFRRVEAHGSGNKEWLVSFGEAQLALLQYDGAEATFKKALKLNNTRAEALLGLGFCRQSQQDYAGAEQWYSKGASGGRYVHHSLFSFLQGETYRLRGMWNEATHHYTIAENRHSIYANSFSYSQCGPRIRALYKELKAGEINWRRAETRGKSEDLNGAIADLYTCIKLGKDDEHLYVALGNTWARAGDTEHAAQAYGVALKENPDNIDAMLGSLCVSHAQPHLLFSDLAPLG